MTNPMRMPEAFALADHEMAAYRTSCDVAESLGRLAIQFRDLGMPMLADSVTDQREIMLRRIREWREGR